MMMHENLKMSWWLLVYPK